MTQDRCPQCPPDEGPCRRCGEPFPHSRNDCDLVQHHTIEAFGVEIPVRVELRPEGTARISDLDGPLVYRVEVQVAGMFGRAGSHFETTDPEVPWVVEQAEENRQASRERHAADKAG